MKEEYNRLYEKVNSRVGDDELMKAVLNNHSKKKNRGARLKLVPIGAAAALILTAGGIVTVAAINKASLEAAATSDGETLPELDYKLPVGKYYLDGNKDSEIWYEVTEDTIQLKGKDLEKTFREDVRLMNGNDKDGNSDIASLVKFHMDQFPISPCKYTVHDLAPGTSYSINYTPADNFSRHAVVFYYRINVIKDYWGEFSWEGVDFVPETNQ